MKIGGGAGLVVGWKGLVGATGAGCGIGGLVAWLADDWLAGLADILDCPSPWGMVVSFGETAFFVLAVAARLLG